MKFTIGDTIIHQGEVWIVIEVIDPSPMGMDFFSYIIENKSCVRRFVWGFEIMMASDHQKNMAEEVTTNVLRFTPKKKEVI